VSEYLFVYGTLLDPAVQLSVFGRHVGGRADAVSGFALSNVTISDADVIAKSREAVHPVLVRSDDPLETIEGIVFPVNCEDLDNADAYETSQYRRIDVELVSGRRSWIYVCATSSAL
jgi:gamma-glutamylcyclotransferase (GGCT)/AIG2-like uncharacterized protein YtfP